MPGPTYSNWTLLVRLLLLAKQYRWGCLRLVALQLVILGLGLTGLALVGLAVDTIALHVRRQGPPPHWPWGIAPPASWTPLATVTILAAAVLAIALVRAVLNYWYAVAMARLLQEQIVVELRAKVYEQLQRLSFRFFSTNSSGSLINRVTADVQSVRLFIDGVILQMVILALSLCCYLAYMLSIDVGLTLLCLASTPALWTMSVRFSRTVRPAYDRNRELSDQMLLTLTENVRGVHVVKGFVRQPEEIEKFRRANRAVRDQQRWIFWRVSLFTPAAEFLLSLNMAALLGYGGYLVLQGRLAMGSGLVAVAGLLQQFAAQVGKMTNIVNSIQQSLAGASRVFEILDARIEVRSPPGAQRLARARGESFSRAFRSIIFPGTQCWRTSICAWSRGSGWRFSAPPGPARPRC